MNTDSKKQTQKEIALSEAERKREVKNKSSGRKKTSIACIHCWKSKTRCGIKRPCDRCKRLGKQCYDRPEYTRKRQNKNIGLDTLCCKTEMHRHSHSHSENLPLPPMISSLFPQNINFKIPPNLIPNFKITDIEPINSRKSHKKKAHKKKKKKKKHRIKKSKSNNKSKKRKRSEFERNAPFKFKMPQLHILPIPSISNKMPPLSEDDTPSTESPPSTPIKVKKEQMSMPPPLKKQRLSHPHFSSSGSNEDIPPSLANSESASDAAPDIIISIRQEVASTNDSDVWSHYTISGGNAYKFKSFYDAENQRVEPCTDNNLSFSCKPIKKESKQRDDGDDVARDLAEIILANSPNSNVSQLLLSNNQSRNKLTTVSMPQQQIPIIPGMPLLPRSSFGVAENAQIGNLNVINNYHIRNIMNQRRQIVPSYNLRPITRITSLIPAPEHKRK